MIKTALKELGYIATGAVVAVAGFVTADSSIQTVKAYVEGVEELIDPTPIQVKKGFFGRKKTVKVNPFTLEMSKYTGNKAPVNKKPFTL